MLEGITALGNWLNCLCVKSKGEEGQAGDREPVEKKKDRAAVGSCRLQSHFLTMVASCRARGAMLAHQWVACEMRNTNKERQCYYSPHYETAELCDCPLACLEMDRFPQRLMATFYLLIQLSPFPSSRPISLIILASVVVIILGVRWKWLAAGLCTAQSLTGAGLCGYRVNNGG